MQLSRHGAPNVCGRRYCAAPSRGVARRAPVRVRATPSEGAAATTVVEGEAATASGAAAAKGASAAASAALQPADAAAAAASQQAAQRLADAAAATLGAAERRIAALSLELRSKAAAGADPDAAAAGLAAFSEAAAAALRGAADDLVPGDAEAEFGARAIAARFQSDADVLRSELAAGKVPATQAASDAASKALAATSELRALAFSAAAAEAARAGAEIRVPGAAGAADGAEGGIADAVKEYGQLWAGLAALYGLNYAIKMGLTGAGIAFPSSLIGMFAVFGTLCALDDRTSEEVLEFFGPAMTLIARWLPIFYVPALVTLPLGLQGIEGSDLLRIVGLLSAGMVATLLFTAQITVIIREAVKTPVQPIAKGKRYAPFEASHYLAWGALAAGSLAVTAFGDAEAGAAAALPLGLAATIGGYLAGSLVPQRLHGVLHPVVVTAVVANAGIALHGHLVGASYETAQQIYLAKGAGPMGAGDLLMSFLGVVIVSFGFRVYTQRGTMKRHFPEIVGATTLSSGFSLFSTAFAAKALGLSSGLALALVPRSVTVALALPIAQQLDAPLSITAAAVLLQGILGANFGPGLMTQAGIKDTIARGLSAAATAGGLGTASLTSKEPEALPYCALSYALVGISSTLLMSSPVVRDAIVSIING